MYISMALKVGVLCTLNWTPHCQKLAESGGQDPTGSPPLHNTAEFATEYSGQTGQ